MEVQNYIIYHLEFFEALKIHFGPKITKTLTLFSIVFSSGPVVNPVL